MTTLRTINEQKRQFWLEQEILMDQRMSDPALIRVATDDMCSQTSRGIPLPWQKSFEVALADAESAKSIIHEELSRKGGRAPKSDALQDLIREIVRHNPGITQPQLLDQLKGEAGVGVVESIDQEADVLAGDVQSIHFVDDNGTPKKASLYGLKDRLRRARKALALTG